jgi:signal peptidase I
VVTFDSPRDGTRLIKRIVAVPGDVVALRDGVLSVNGAGGRVHGHVPEVVEALARWHQRAARCRPPRQLAGTAAGAVPAGASAARAFGPLTLGADQFFMLGDNRDNSEDSRYIGPVPRELIIGRAHHVLVSADILGHWLPRLERTVSAIR